MRVGSTLSREIAFNGKARPLVWTNLKAREGLDGYLRYRREAHHGISTAHAAYRGLDPLSPLFLTRDGSPFTFNRHIMRTGAVSYSCETLNEIIRCLHTQAGIEHGNANAARRTFAVTLHRRGRSPKLIQTLVGVSNLAAVKRLVDGDPVTLASVVRGVI